MGDVWRLSDVLSRAEGFVPKTYVGRPEAISAAILTGAELGLGPMESLRSIHMVEGRPTMSAELMLARARSQGVRSRWERTDATAAVLLVWVPGDSEPQRMAYSMDDAKAAGLSGRGNWSKFPANMLRARAISAAIRAFCPEVLGASGVYEADSGELSDGIPSAEVRVSAMPAEPVGVVTAGDAPKPRSAGKGLSACSSADELRAWCEQHGAAVIARGAVAKVVAHGESLAVGAATVREWLGIVEEVVNG